MKHTFPAPRMIVKQCFLSCVCASSHEVCCNDMGLRSNFLCHKKSVLRTHSLCNKLWMKHTFPAPRMIAWQYFLSCACASSHEVCCYDMGLRSNFPCHYNNLTCEILRLRRGRSRDTIPFCRSAFLLAQLSALFAKILQNIIIRLLRFGKLRVCRMKYMSKCPFL